MKMWNWIRPALQTDSEHCSDSWSLPLFSLGDTIGKRNVLQTLVNARKISTRSSADGKPTCSTLSSRPGRKTAGSIMSCRLVAAIKNTPFRASTPSISVNSWLTTRTLAPPSPWSDLFGHNASISSKNITQGAECLARWKQVRTARSDSPTY